MLINEKQIKKYFFENREYYQMMEQWHKDHQGIALESSIKKLLAKNLNVIPKNSRVLDMGCGEGSVTIWLAQNYPKLFFIGADISSVGIELSESKKLSISNVQFIADNIQHSKIENESIAFILSQSVLEHLTDYKEALRECWRILVPGDKILIRVGNGARLGKGLKGFIRDFFKYLFRLNRDVVLNPTFDLSGKDSIEKIKKHQSEFDLVKISSDTILNYLKSIGFKIEYFSTCKEEITFSEKYKKANWLKKLLIEIYVKLNIFPFNHMGHTTIIMARKECVG